MTEDTPQPSPQFELHELRVGRLPVPEEANDLLSLVHRQPGVVNVWMTGSTLSLECQPGSVDRAALVERLSQDGYRVA
jgi:hypothetical protein